MAMNHDEQGLTEFEAAVLTKLLTGDHPVLEALRSQFESCRVGSREATGHGFFVNLDVPRSPGPAPAPVRRFQVSGVGAAIPGLKHGAGFVLFIEEGYISFLEGFSYEEPWPTEVSEFSLRFEGPRSEDECSIGLPE